MYDVYYKRNNQKKIILIIVGIIAVVIVGVIAFMLLSGDDSKKVLEDYYAKVEQGKYKQLYEMLDDESKKNYSQDEFIERNENIYEGIEAKNISIEITDSEDGKLKYHVNMDTLAGKSEFDNETVISDGKISWDDSFIYPTLKKDYKIRVRQDEATRGNINDRNGNMLAGEGEAYSVGLVPGKLNGENDYEKIGQLLGLTKESIQKTMNASWIKDDSFVPLKTITKNDETLKNNLLTVPGVKLSTTIVRTYPYGEVTSHLTGYMQRVNADDLKKHKGEGYSETSYIGRSGIEAAYEKELKGTDGVEIYVANSDGDEISSIASQEREDGKNINLTIDINLQNELYNAYQQDKSASVAMNPNTGEILALVSTPSFNSNDFILGMSTEKWDELNNNEMKPLNNRFKATFVPGSSMKPITGAIGLDTDSLDKDKDFNAEMKWQKDSSWGSYYVTTLHAPKPNNLKNALIYSDNVYFAKAALEIGKDNLESGYKKLKIGEKIPFELSLNKSQYTSDKFNDEIQIADSGYGQGQILMNPVQMASIYSAFVNNGDIMTPYIVQDTDSKIWIENAFSETTAKEICEDLKGVINDPNGTAYAMNSSKYQLAGKTGTGEIKASQDDTTGTEIGWFTVMTVDSDNPILITSMVEDVKNRGGSGYVVNHTKQLLDNYLK